MTGLMQLDDSILCDMFLNAGRVLVGGCCKRLRNILKRCGSKKRKLYVKIDLLKLYVKIDLIHVQIAFLKSFSHLVVIMVSQLSVCLDDQYVCLADVITVFIRLLIIQMLITHCLFTRKTCSRSMGLLQ